MKPLLLALVLATPAAAGTLVVPTDFPTVQAAVDAAVENETILILPGTYVGPVVVGKRLSIVGSGADVTVLDGGGQGTALLATRSVQVEGLTFTGGGDGLSVQGDSAYVVTDCDFVGNSGWGFTGSSVGVSFVLAECRFLGNGAGGARVWVDFGSPFDLPQIRHCVLAGGDGVEVAQGVTIFVHAILDHVTLDGGDVESAGSVWMTNCILRGGVLATASGATVWYSDVEGGAVGPGNIDADPLWIAPGAQDWSLQPGSPCINSGDPSFGHDPDGSVFDMGAVAYDPWDALGGGVAGAAGLATLAGHGPLTAGAQVDLVLEGAPASTGVVLLVGASELGAPFKGGVLWPEPDLLLGLVTDVAGALQAGAAWPAGLPSGLAFWSQAWWPDAGAILQFAASNGVRGTVP